MIKRIIKSAEKVAWQFFSNEQMDMATIKIVFITGVAIVLTAGAIINWIG